MQLPSGNDMQLEALRIVLAQRIFLTPIEVPALTADSARQSADRSLFPARPITPSFYIMFLRTARKSGLPR